MLRALFSCVFWTFLLVSSAALFPIALVLWALTAPFDRRLAALHAFTSFWASLYTWLQPGWRVEIVGRERIGPGPYVMVANHLSLLDIPLLFRLFVHFKWVARHELFRVPFVGWNMSLNRYIRLRRGDRSSAGPMLAACERALAQGSSVLIFPEGQRSSDGKLQTFKSGAFRLARTTGAPLLPIVIQGTGSALPRRGLLLEGKHALRMRVLEPIPSEEFAGCSDRELAERVRARFARELGESTSSGIAAMPANPARAAERR
jgi:1-acyl-sn-glycerol-3-phosphate acyltransferase